MSLALPTSLDCRSYFNTVFLLSFHIPPPFFESSGPWSSQFSFPPPQLSYQTFEKDYKTISNTFPSRSFQTFQWTFYRFMQDSYCSALLKCPIIILAPSFYVGDLVTYCHYTLFDLYLQIFCVFLLFSFIHLLHRELCLFYIQLSHPFNLFFIPFPGICLPLSVFSFHLYLLNALLGLQTLSVMACEKQQTSKRTKVNFPWFCNLFRLLFSWFSF